MGDQVYGFLCRNPQIKNYFLDYKREDWDSILFATVLFGIQSIQATHNRNLSVQELHEKLKRAGTIKNVEETIPSLKSKLQSLQKEIFMLEEQLEEKSKKVEFDVEPSYQQVIKPKVKKVDFWNQTDLRRKKDNKEQPKLKKQAPWSCDYSNFVKNSPPRHESSEDYKESEYSKEILINEREKESSKDLRFSGYDKKYATEQKELKVSSDSKEFKQSGPSREMVYSVSKATSSGSSMSHYNPTEDMKKFYRNEFGKFLESRGTNKDEDSEY